MILDELPYSAKGKLLVSKIINCKCDICSKEFSRRVAEAIKNQICKSCTIKAHNKMRDANIHRKMIENAANNRRGKSNKEFYGSERAETIGAKMSASRTGEKNPNFGGKFSRGFADHPLSGSWEERFGKEKADARKKLMSSLNSGANNPMYGRSTPNGAGSGISGWYRNEYYFRSLLELAFILDRIRKGIKFESAERKEFRFAYKCNDVDRTYVPDFIDENGKLYEVKPFKLIGCKINILKQLAAPEVIWLTEHDLIRPTLAELNALIDAGIVEIDYSKKWRVK